MKKLLQLLTTIALVLLGEVLFGQNLEFTLRYNIPLARYEVYARPSSTNATFAWGPSQISIVAPAIVPDGAFTVTSVSAGAWQDNSIIIAPAVTPGFDYHGLGSLGAPTNLMMNVEKLIFHFTITGGCYAGLRLFINGSDPNSAAAGMGGGDFSNTVSDGLAQERYIGNYNNTGTTCFPDTDGDTVTDNVDLDDDNDGILDTVENGQLSTDTDGDGVINSLDPDSDNDGISDVDEAGGIDLDRDGEADDNDGMPANNNGIPSTAGTGDTLTGDDFDGDNRPNPYDLDSDNDAINDIIESGNPNLVDANDNGVVDGPDTDGDGIPDSADNFVGFGDAADPTPVNTDAAGGPNYLDIDSDGDNLTDIEESGVANPGTLDANDDGFIDNNSDPEGDGIPQVVDGAPAVFGDANDPNLPDNTNDGDPDYTDPNNAPVITSDGGGPTASISIPENTTAVTTVTATDPENLYGTPKFSITGGADAALFSINAATGVLAFTSARNFENPTDVGANNIYDVQVTVTDHGGLTDVQDIAVTITNVNETPDITSNGGGPNASVSVPENTTAVTTVMATDPDGNALTFTITGGADAALFSVNPTTGALTFNAPPDFENPTDAGLNNVYDVQVTVSDGNGGTDVQNIAVTVTDVNEAPTITSNGAGATATIPIVENTTAVTTVTATDPENLYGTPKFSITGGADAALFSINPTTGALAFITAPNFEVPTDANTDNNYEVTVRVTDAGGLFDEQAITVPVTNANENPDITSNGGGPNASVSIPENTTAVTTVTATDPENGTVTFSITGGADQALFTINPTTGALSFITPKDFENPTDVGLNNVYDVQVTATDPLGSTDVQAIAVTVTNVNEAPTITSNGAGPTANIPVAENTTAVTTVTATDPENAFGVPKFTITGGADAALFTINAATGALSFITAPDFEVPTDAGANNVYDVQVTVNDAGGLTDVQDITVPVTNANENPIITSDGGGASAGVSIPENTTAVTTVTATDPENGTVTFSITGGADQALFTINPTTGALSFLTPKDFENPTDVGTNNVYDVQVTATDPLGGTDVQAIAVTVTNVNEAPTITSNGAGPTANIPVAENTTAVTTVTATDPENAFGVPKFTITGGADAALFTINAATGALSFITAPDFEVPTDAGANNVYDVQVTVNDAGGLTDVQDITVPVTNANENPIITSNGGGASASVSIPENTTAVTTVTATDPENGTVTFSITGGADQALFTINPTTGALSFITPKDFENPTDVGANNVYDVQITATDPLGGTDVQAIAVTVTNVNEAPTITSNGAGPTATIPVVENTTAVTTVVATDPENATLTYSIVGGADAALFSINPTTGALTFITPPNFEVPTDANADNNYLVTVRATDPGGLFDEQAITVPVTNANENPDITSNGGGPNASVSIPENTTAVTTVTATDPDGNPVTFSITGGPDAALFTINPTTGALTFNTPPDFENPTDVGTNNVYNVQVTASDGNGGTDVQAIAVTVTNVNEAPSITSNGGGATASISVPENTTPVTTVTATDPENLYGTPKFSITGGADAALFTIDANTGALAFVSGRNFESPTDAGANNVYDVQVTVTDAGALTDVQAIAVTVTDVDENGRLRMKVLLQGALLNTGTPGVMRDDLRSNAYVPLNDPYTTSGNPRFAHAGGGAAASTTNLVLNADAGTPDAIVDWVFVELRSSANSSVVLETRAALVQRDGDVVSPVDGDSPLEFINQAGTSYFVAIKHRNHLGAMTASAQTLTVGGTVVDFTTMSNANVFNNAGYDGAEMITIGAVKALWAGNANADVKVKYQGPSNDNMTILNQVLTHPSNAGGAFNFDLALGYYNGDINMDGKVKYQGTGNDPAFIFANLITNYTLNAMDLYNYDLFIEQLP